jgi:hypothetical protein
MINIEMQNFSATKSDVANNSATNVNLCTAVSSEHACEILTDEQLLKLCKKYGESARFWRQKFAGLLPQVYKRRLYERKGFSSIFEFAAKFAGMSQEQVRLVLNLKQKFEDKPALQELLLNGKVSANKLVRIAAVATPENQEFLAEKVQIFSKNAIDTFVKDIRYEAASAAHMGAEIAQSMAANAEDPDALQKPLFEGKSLPGQRITASITELVKLRIDEDLLKELLILQEKNIDINKLIRKMLEQRETGIARAKEAVAEEMRMGSKVQTKNLEQEKQVVEAVKNAGQPSRYIPAKIQKIINEEQGDKCAAPGCCKNAQVTHHEIPFAVAGNHDPQFLKKLCKAHHEIAHMVNVKFYRHTRSDAKCVYE